MRRLVLTGVSLGLAVLGLAWLTWRAGPGEEAPPGPTFVRLEPQGAEAEMLGDGHLTKRRAIRTHVPSTLSWSLQVPARGRLRTHLSFAPRTEEDLVGTTCHVAVDVVGPGGARERVIEREVEPHLGWDAYGADLARWAGRRVVLSLGVDCVGGGGKRTWEDAVRWSVPVVYTVRPGEWRNVLLVTIDTLRADHLHVYGYPRETSPAIDALAGRGLLFEKAETVQSATWPALTSLHTSLYPSAHGVMWNGHAPPEPVTTLAQLLGAKGYRTSAFLTNMKRALHPGFSRLSISGEGEQYVEDAEVTDLAIEQLHIDRERPFFIWLHLISPHAGYQPPPEWKGRFGDGAGATVSGGIDELVHLRETGRHLREEDVAHVVDLYDAEVGFADSQVGRLLAALKALDLEERTLVVLTADHGEDLYAHNDYPFHSPSMYSSSLDVPLVLALPGVLPEGERTDHPASLLDVAPTILSVLDLPIPPAFQGRSLLSGGVLPPAPARRSLFSETNGSIYGVSSEGWRLIVNPGGEPPGAPGGPYPIAPVELYSLAQDPAEQRNLAGAHPEVVERLEGRIEEWRARDLRRDLPSQTLDAKTREELRALGYLVE